MTEPESVYERRLARGWTQEELASRARLSVRTVRTVESGEGHPTPATMRRLHTALDAKPPPRNPSVVECPACGHELQLVAR